MLNLLSSQFNSKKTKIVATLGPASTTEDIIRKMIQKGLNVARINFSHGEHEEHGARIDMVRRIASEEGVVVGILCDIQGPKIRIGKIEGSGLPLQAGDQVTLTLDKNATGKDNIIALPHPEFVRDIKAGMQLLLDDGNLEFVVDEVAGQTLKCTVVLGGLLTSRKGVMAPKARLTLSAITDKDRADIEYALSKNADYLAMSFVRSADDIREMRWLMRHLGSEDTAIIAKIEKHEALENIESIIAVVDGIMVARGDLGIETPAEEVPYHQKRIIQLCNEASKPVITATQMLSSMVESPRPTRAEASDVYNAIVDGTDAVMLSNETAAGKYPLMAVETMATIANIAEQHLKQNRQLWDIPKPQGDGREAAADAISESTYHISEALAPRAIVTSTLTGYTAKRVARERPRTPIICVTPNETTYRRMTLVWGVTPLLVPHFHTIDEMLQVIGRATHDAGLVKRGDMLIIIAGVPFGIGGQTNLLKIHRVGEANEI
ncbi:MAG TPA: pyruvate kinase [Phototrophicaceae bacterium]|nr:pyruvate kinase [Phototrophicaceae bacterium]